MAWGNPAMGWDLAWRIGYTGIVENREYFGLPLRSQTFFVGRLNAGTQVVFDSTHTIAAEVSVLHEFGGAFDRDLYWLAAHYRFARRPFLFIMGVFPREGSISFPRALLKDSVTYYRPYIEGGCFEVASDWGRQSLFIDWVGRQTPEKREQFLIGLSGGLQPWRLFGDYYLLYFHDAGRQRVPPDPLSEYYGGQARAGVAFVDTWRIDSIAVGVGALLSTSRTRDSTDWSSCVGLTAGVDVLAQRLGFRGNLYCGEPQRAQWGDGLYNARTYIRLDVFGVPILSERVRATFGWCTHIVDGEVGFSQEFDLLVRVGRTRSVGEDVSRLNRRLRNDRVEDL